MREPKQEVYTTTLSSRGQLVLPAPVRRKLRLHKGARIQVVLSNEKDQAILQPEKPRSLADWCGLFPGAGKALKLLQQERKKERSRGR